MPTIDANHCKINQLIIKPNYFNLYWSSQFLPLIDDKSNYILMNEALPIISQLNHDGRGEIIQE